MVKPKVLLIKTGGTIGQKPNDKGILEPSADEYIQKVEGLEELADIEVRDLGNIDSTNMETNLNLTDPTEAERTKDRSDVARVIYENAFGFDGFVVVHGTCSGRCRPVWGTNRAESGTRRGSPCSCRRSSA